MDLVRVVQRSENGYIGLNNGIMDQFASIFGEPGRALLLDCRSLEHRVDPAADLDDVALVACHSGSRAQARDVRVQRAARAVRGGGRGRSREIEPGVTLAARRDARDARGGAGPPGRRPRETGRAHRQRERPRPGRAIEAFEAGVFDEVGRLFYASHDSLRDLYEAQQPGSRRARRDREGDFRGHRGEADGRRLRRVRGTRAWCAATPSTASATPCCATTRPAPA